MNVLKYTRAFAIGGLGLALAVQTGCNSPAKYVDPNGPDTIVTLDQIDIQDWNKAASGMVQSLLDSGELDKAARKPAVMAISRITNKTTENVDVDLLTKNIRISLNQSGKVRTSTTMGLGEPEDPLAKDSQRAQDFFNGTSRQAPDLPDYSLSGKILQTNAQAAATKQVTYTFQLSLTDRSGLAVWEGQRQITKQGRRNGVGW